MIYLVLVKKDMLRYVEDVRTMRVMRRELSDHHVKLGCWLHGLRGER